MAFFCQYSWFVVSVRFSYLNIDLIFKYEYSDLSGIFTPKDCFSCLLPCWYLSTVFEAVTMYITYMLMIAGKVWLFSARECKHMFKNVSCWIVKQLNSEFWLWILFANELYSCRVIPFLWITVLRAVCLNTNLCLFFLLGCEVRNDLFDWTAPLFTLQMDTRLSSDADVRCANRK